jgi:hypothetical protein
MTRLLKLKRCYRREPLPIRNLISRKPNSKTSYRIDPSGKLTRSEDLPAIVADAGALHRILYCLESEQLCAQAYYVSVKYTLLGSLLRRTQRSHVLFSHISNATRRSSFDFEPIAFFFENTDRRSWVNIFGGGRCKTWLLS